MNAWEYFFRYEEDGVIFQKFGMEHILGIIYMLGIGYLIYHHRDSLKKNKKMAGIVQGILILLMSVQLFIYYYFYIASGHFTLGLNLPLYTCRITVICAILGILFHSEKLKTVTIYWGLIGGILSMIVPTVLPYAFPHAMYVNFFMIHILIFWAALFFLFVEGYSFDWKNLKFMFQFANIMLLACSVCNYFFGGNYSYLSESPVMTDFFAAWYPPVYQLLAFGIYNLLIGLVYFFAKICQREHSVIQNAYHRIQHIKERKTMV